jgi:CIC family chloride channel protein
VKHPLLPAFPFARLRTGELNGVSDWVASSPSGLVLLALLVGAGAGAGAVAFRYLILGFTFLFTGHRDFSAAGHALNPAFPWLGIWFVVLIPVVGGLLYGPLVDRFAKEARGHGVPEVMLAVSESGGKIRPQVAIVKSLASALCIGSGGSVGREGPIVQIGSALGSTLGQVARVPESRLRLLVACGAAGGISATFNAPIAGVFFALELILRDFETEAFGVVVLASVTADVIGRAAFGSHPFLSLPPFELSSVAEYGFYAGLGVLAAVVGVVFVRVLYGIEDVFDRVWKAPEWLRPAAGGILLGLLLLAVPQLYGVGYPVLENAIRGQYVLWLLMLLLGAKVLATSLTIGIGGSGGVFAPSLFMGAMLGAAYGSVLHHLAPGIAGSAGAYGIVGMGAVFAGAAGAPITAVLIIFELTGEYQIILPLMLAVVLATAISRLMAGDTIYTLKLRRRGIDITRRRDSGVFAELRVRDAMRAAPAVLQEDSPWRVVMTRLSSDGTDGLAVVDPHGALVGIITRREAEAAVREAQPDPSAGDLAVKTQVLGPDQSLDEALKVLVHHDGSGLPVVAPFDRRILGWLNHRDVLRAYNQRANGISSPSPVTVTNEAPIRANSPGDKAAAD